MNDQNLDYLQNNLKYLGFGETLNDSLKSEIVNAPENFNLKIELSFPMAGQKEKPELADVMKYELSFSKSKDTDMYFFNKYEAQLSKAGNADMLSQTFYINKGKGVTAKESFNLLDNRSVNKDVVLKSGEKANVWMKLDFSEHKDGNAATNTYGEKYGFSLADTVDRFKIADMEKLGFKDQLLKSLERGNLHQVSFSKDGREMNGFVTANPQFKTLDFFDKDLKPVYSKALDLNESKVLAKKDDKQEKEAVIEESVGTEVKKGRGR